MSRFIQQKDINHLVGILVEKAVGFEAGPKQYFSKLILKATLPKNLQAERAYTWTGDPELDAIRLVNWAVNQGVNPSDPKYETLGSILAASLADWGLEEQRWIVAFIAVYGLYLDSNQLEELLRTYNVPRIASQVPAEPQKLGPAIDWKGPTEEVELQSWLKPEPEFIDVGYLKKVIERAASVCRVDLENRGRSGTGVLIAPTFLLTNYHVLKKEPAEDIQQNAKDVTLSFGCISGETSASAAVMFKLAGEAPVLKSSPVEKLDYVLLRVEDKVTQVKGIEPSILSDSFPDKGMALSILQHPGGQTLKLAMSTNGVTGVYQNRGLVQYVTRTAGGSSGSPCFDEDWKIIALHHAERSRAFGAIREGILSRSIHDDIKEYLP
jgi:endonuclease G